jgi:hypothetical protein
MTEVTFRNVPDYFSNAIFKHLKLHSNSMVWRQMSEVASSDIHFELNFDFPNKKLFGKYNVLIASEPASVVPWQYKKNILSRFDLIIPTGKTRSENLSLKEWVPFPYKFQAHTINEKLRINNVIMINAAKFSAHKESLYGLRRKTSKELFNLQIGYKLAGENWKMPKTKEIRERIWAVRKEMRAGNLPNLQEAFSHIFYRFPEYSGRVDNKITELSKYKYALVIENEPDYISEKLFDAIAAKCVPIYVGENLADFKFLKNCVVQLAPKISSILEFFGEENQQIYDEKKKYLDNVENYATDIRSFSLEMCSSRIAHIVYQHFVGKK